jgi:hypothetical protein
MSVWIGIWVRDFLIFSRPHQQSLEKTGVHPLSTPCSQYGMINKIEVVLCTHVQHADGKSHALFSRRCKCVSVCVCVCLYVVGVLLLRV